MEVPQSANVYTLNSLLVRIRYTGTHALKHFKVEEELKDGEKVYSTHIRGRRLIGKEMPLEYQAHILTKQFDTLQSLGVCEKGIWFEREGVENNKTDKLKEMVEVAESIHG